MVRLSIIIYVLVATVFSGVAVTALLTMKMLQPWQIAGAAGLGAILAIPVAWVIGKRIYTAMSQQNS